MYRSSVALSRSWPACAASSSSRSSPISRDGGRRQHQLMRIGAPLGPHGHRFAAPDQLGAALAEVAPAPARQVARARRRSCRPSLPSAGSRSGCRCVRRRSRTGRRAARCRPRPARDRTRDRCRTRPDGARRRRPFSGRRRGETVHSSRGLVRPWSRDRPSTTRARAGCARASYCSSATRSRWRICARIS